MSRYNRRNNKRNKKNKKGISRATQLKRLAYNMGQVEKGLKNSESQISDSYNAGLNRTAKQKKSLF